MKAFHSFRAASFPPTEEGNFAPLKARGTAFLLLPNNGSHLPYLLNTNRMKQSCVVKISIAMG
jgi:hypothetical protein